MAQGMEYGGRALKGRTPGNHEFYMMCAILHTLNLVGKFGTQSLLIVYCLLPIAYCLLPIAHYFPWIKLLISSMSCLSDWFSI